MEGMRDEIIALSKALSSGPLLFEEVLTVANKMAFIRSTDDGFGNIVIEMTRNGNQDKVRIRVIQDKVIAPYKADKNVP